MEDERLANIERQKQEALNNSSNTYNQILQDNQNLYDQSINNSDLYEKTQNDILDKQLAFNQEQIEKQKEIARQNMETEQKKAKNDYTAFINPYGYQAESLASNGLLNTGLAETTKLGGFNTYQNRLATANKTMQDAFVQYDKDINEARLQNDVQKAQNALNKLQIQLEYAQNFYTNKSNTMLNQLNTNQSINSDYYNRYQTEYNNIQNELQRAEQIRQWEAEMAEKQRQYNASLEFQKQQAAQEQANWEKQYALSKASASRSSSSKSSSSKSSSSGISLSSADNSGEHVNPYTGTVNYDAQYGTFSNGYQPDNIGGSKLRESGSTTTVNGNTQNIWIYDNGQTSQLVVWDGKQNQYVPYKGVLSDNSYKTFSISKK